MEIDGHTVPNADSLPSIDGSPLDRFGQMWRDRFGSGSAPLCPDFSYVESGHPCTWFSEGDYCHAEVRIDSSGTLAEEISKVQAAVVEGGRIIAHSDRDEIVASITVVMGDERFVLVPSLMARGLLSGRGFLQAYHGYGRQLLQTFTQGDPTELLVDSHEDVFASVIEMLVNSSGCDCYRYDRQSDEFRLMSPKYNEPHAIPPMCLDAETMAMHMTGELVKRKVPRNALCVGSLEGLLAWLGLPRAVPEGRLIGVEEFRGIMTALAEHGLVFTGRMLPTPPAGVTEVETVRALDAVGLPVPKTYMVRINEDGSVDHQLISEGNLKKPEQSVPQKTKKAKKRRPGKTDAGAGQQSTILKMVGTCDNRGVGIVPGSVDAVVTGRQFSSDLPAGEYVFQEYIRHTQIINGRSVAAEWRTVIGDDGEVLAGMARVRPVNKNGLFDHRAQEEWIPLRPSSTLSLPPSLDREGTRGPIRETLNALSAHLLHQFWGKGAKRVRNVYRETGYSPGMGAVTLDFIFPSIPFGRRNSHALPMLTEWHEVAELAPHAIAGCSPEEMDIVTYQKKRYPGRPVVLVEVDAMGALSRIMLRGLREQFGIQDPTDVYLLGGRAVEPYSEERAHALVAERAGVHEAMQRQGIRPDRRSGGGHTP